jgi:ribosomal protein S18 acetylase RimI-like enzyme
MEDEIRVGDLSALPLRDANFASLHRLCLRSSEFYDLIGDALTAESAAAEILGPLEEPYARGIKHVFGLLEAGEVFAVADLLEGHPTPGEWVIGLLLVDPAHRRKGFGRQLAGSILGWIAGNGGTVVRLIVHQQNPGALAFWRRLGFEVEYETQTVVGRRSSVAWVLSVRLPVA